jgi:hypothetical protein
MDNDNYVDRGHITGQHYNGNMQQDNNYLYGQIHPPTLYSVLPIYINH